MKKILAFIAVLFLASAAIPKEQEKQGEYKQLKRIPVNNIQETKEAYSRLANSVDTLSINFDKLP